MSNISQTIRYPRCVSILSGCVQTAGLAGSAVGSARPKPVRKCVESNLSDRLPRLYITVAVRRQMFILPDLAAGRCDARGFFPRFCRRPLKHKSGPASGRAPILKTAVGWDRIGVCSVALPRHRRPRAGLQTAPRRHSGSKMNFCPPMEASYISPPLLWTKTAIPLT